MRKLRFPILLLLCDHRLASLSGHVLPSLIDRMHDDDAGGDTGGEDGGDTGGEDGGDAGGEDEGIMQASGSAWWGDPHVYHVHMGYPPCVMGMPG